MNQLFDVVIAIAIVGLYSANSIDSYPAAAQSKDSSGCSRSASVISLPFPVRRQSEAGLAFEIMQELAQGRDELLLKKKPTPGDKKDYLLLDEGKEEDDLLLKDKPKAVGPDDLLLGEKPKVAGPDDLLLEEKPKAAERDDLLLEEENEKPAKKKTADAPKRKEDDIKPSKSGLDHANLFLERRYP